MGAGHVRASPIRPCLFGHSRWSWALWGSRLLGWGLVAGGRFFAVGPTCSSLYAGAGAMVDAAGSAALRPGWEVVAGGWALVMVWVLAWAWVMV